MKHRLQHIWKRFKRIHPALFIVVTLLSAVVAVFALRANNQHMIELRKAVYSADEKNGDVQGALRELQNYVTRHMNTDLSSGNGSTVYPPVQLKYTYERLVRAQGDAVNQANNQIYSAAQAFCEQQNATDVSGRNRIPCIEKYVQERTPAGTQTIPDALYKFGFTSPKWSPDFAGWTIFITIVGVIVSVVSVITRLFDRKHTKK